MLYNYIGIEGNIGVGKTTLVKQLSDHLKAFSFFEEFNENPWLPLFYQNPKDTALALELSFLTDRCKQLISVQKEQVSNILVSDYCLDKCLLFAEANLSAIDFDTYKKLYRRIAATIKKPDLVIVLHAPVEALQQNIKNRGRVYEQEIKTTYLKKLNTSYLQFFSEEKDYTVLNIHTSTTHEKKYERIFTEIVSFLEIKSSHKNNSITILE